MTRSHLRQALSHEKLTSLLHYDAKTGRWTWLIDRNGRIKAGDEAGTLHRPSRGRTRVCRHITIEGIKYRSSRLAYFFVTGEWPPHEIDHKNGDATDDRWNNLRSATKSQNGFNRGALKNNKTGRKGVCIHRSGRYQAQIGVDGRYIYLGLFDTVEDASNAYTAAAKKYHGEFAVGVRR